jgi:hypothetical protein
MWHQICSNGQLWNFQTQTCQSYADNVFDRPKSDTCIPCILAALGADPNPGFGDPIFPLTGSNRQEINFGISLGGQDVKLTYDTSTKVPEVNKGATWTVPAPPSFGAMWQSNLHKSLTLQSSGDVGAAYSSVAMQRGDSAPHTATLAGGGCSGSGGNGGTSYASPATPNLKVLLGVWAAEGKFLSSAEGVGPL